MIYAAAPQGAADTCCLSSPQGNTEHEFVIMHLTKPMKRIFGLLTLSSCLIGTTLAPGSQMPQDSPATTGGQGHKQSNAASATKDNSAISGDQVTKPAGAKSTIVIGCLRGPDADGHFVLNSMQYRSGVEVLGPDSLYSAAGQKVKLTGQWVSANPGPNDASKEPARRFQATSFDVLAEKCPPPAETTPISKRKQKQLEGEQKQKAATQSSANTPK